MERCLVCGDKLARRRWWQRGVLRPLPLCPYVAGRECYDRARDRWRV